MYIEDFLNQFKDFRVRLFVDMDGVVADYDVGNPSSYDKKRPLIDSIKKLEFISNMDNIDMYILSVSRMHDGIKEKNDWLDKYAPFFKKDNRIIIAREDNNFEHSKDLKKKYITNLYRDDSKIIVIDDDPEILKEISKINKDVILLKDTALVD